MIATLDQPIQTEQVDYPPPSQPPHHVGIIMDGNGRWATRQGKRRHDGHKAGTENIRRIVEYSGEFGVKMLTLFAFSTENWSRPNSEVQGLLLLLRHVLDNEVTNLHHNGVQVRHLGNIDALSPIIQRKIAQAIDLTRHNDRLILNIAFNYGGRAEIVRAVQQMLADQLSPDEVTENRLQDYLYTGHAPDPDLIIRTSGEYRTSNFMIWQAAYAEYYFSPVYWPDFGKFEYWQALKAFSDRERRFGGVEHG